jgi:spectinomycin phosphotransferase
LEAVAGVREPPRLADTAIITALHAQYGLARVKLTFLPLGADSASFVYRVDAVDGASFLLKVRSGRGFSAPSLAVPQHLHVLGVPHLIAPIPSRSQALWVWVDGFALSLYPFVEGRVGADVGLSQAQWQELGMTLKQIHSVSLPPELMKILPREAFVPSRRNLLMDLEAIINA